METLTTTNALMKEDLAIAKNNLLALYEENRHLRQECGKDVENYLMTASGIQIKNSTDGRINNKVVGAEIDELRQRLDEERKLRKDADNELELQVSFKIILIFSFCIFSKLLMLRSVFIIITQMCLKAEMEVAMKLLEKDIHEKQDTIGSLRRQLDDIKLINLEMYRKLQVSRDN